MARKGAGGGGLNSAILIANIVFDGEINQVDTTVSFTPLTMFCCHSALALTPLNQTD